MLRSPGVGNLPMSSSFCVIRAEPRIRAFLRQATRADETSPSPSHAAGLHR